MKRYTLCKVCFAMVVLLFLMLQTGYLPRAYDTDACGGPVTVCGVVRQIEEKESADHQRQIIISLCAVAFCNGDFPNDQNRNLSIDTGKKYAEGILCYLEEGETVPLIGEQVVISGQAQAFPSRRNPGGFDGAAYYRAKGLLFSVEKARILKRGETYSGPGQTLYECRRYLGSVLDAVCGEDAGVMKAMLLGDKTSLSSDLKSLYQTGGISHILAISGLHISFLGMGLYRLLRKVRFPLPLAAAASGLLIGAYAVMTGASPSSCRAAMMFVISLTADMLGRSYERMTALSLSALILTARQPTLLCQSGFLLSYGAVLGLALICPVLCGLWESRAAKPFLAGISVSAVTLPVILTSFFSFPVFSFLLNLVVIPLMGIVMALGLLSLLAGMCWAAAGRLLFFPVHMILALFRVCCALTERLPGHIWLTGAPSRLQIVLYYTLILTFCLIRKYMTKPCALLLLLGGVWILRTPVLIGDTVTMLDVGQGDGIVIRGQDGTAVMIDGGSTSERELAEYTLAPYVKSQGIRELDYVFLTHMDADHVNGIEELMANGGKNGLRIKTLVLPALTEQDEDYVRVAAAARAAGIRLCRMDAGDALEAGGFTFFCLHPREGMPCADRNAASLVLYVRKGKFSALFMGDLDGEEESVFAERYPERLGAVTVLKAGHHGSKASCGEAFLAKCRPKITLVSCGENNRYGHPDRETLNRIAGCGSRVYVTKDEGAVRVWVFGDRVRVKVQKAG